MISRTVEYALRAMVFLAGQPEMPHTTQRIAERTRVPAGYLSKVLQHLGRAELIHSQRGLHGGSKLTRPPEEISLLEVVNAVDPIERINECPLGLDAHSDQLCPLHHKLDDALASVEQAFATTTLADLVNTPSNIEPLCEVTVSR